VNQHPDHARLGTPPPPAPALAFVIGTAATATAGLLIQVGVVPTTEVSEDLWRYPWESSRTFLVTAVLYAALHVLIISGLVTFARRRIAGPSTAARRGVRLAIAGTVMLLVGELASIPLHDAKTDDTDAMVVGAVFGLALVCSAIGFLVCGWTTMRAGAWTDWRRFTPIATGVWTLVMLPLTTADPTLLPGSVGIYGLCLLGMASGIASEAWSDRVSVAELELQRA